MAPSKKKKCKKQGRRCIGKGGCNNRKINTLKKGGDFGKKRIKSY
jgi:hypothetical protein